jgi:hypothetical protein
MKAEYIKSISKFAGKVAAAMPKNYVNLLFSIQ